MSPSYCPQGFKITGIYLKDVRCFKGEHFVPLHEKLTVLMGRNNAGKSTLLRAPAALLTSGSGSSEWVRTFIRQGCDTASIAMRIECTGSSLAEATFDTSNGNGTDLRDALMRLQVRSSQFTTTTLSTIQGFQNWHNPTTTVSFEIGADITSNGDRMRWLRLLGVNEFNSVSSTFVQYGPRGSASLATGSAHAMPYSIAQGLPAIFGVAVEALPSAIGKSSPIATWSHGGLIPKEHNWPQPTRRLVRDDEEEVKQTLTFLKMKHESSAFAPLRSALLSSFKEFSDLHFVDEGGYKFRPAFELPQSEALRESQPLTREVLGSGLWSYLCMLTAARAAKATGARTLVLDEPHLYLHPGLERDLIRRLMDSSEWDSAPLQLIVSTHSPAFVDQAWRDCQLAALDWEDDSRKSVVARNVTSFKIDAAQKLPHLWDNFISSPSDFLYSDRVVFVEGPSDVAAIRYLIDALNLTSDHVHIEPLLVADRIKHRDMISVPPMIARSRRGGFLLRPILMLDHDKKVSAEKAWSTLQGEEDPHKTMRVVYAGRPQNDFESCFCHVDFLVQYFRSLASSESLEDIPSAIEEELAKVPPGNPAANAGDLPKSQKGCVAIETLHRRLLGDEWLGANKEQLLMHLIGFFVRHIDKPYSGVVKASLDPVIAALKSR